jgi:hypothetical protein
MKLRNLRAQFRCHAVAPDTLFLLNSKDAIDLVERATAEGIKLAGVEGFLVTDAGAFEPQQDFSNDVADWNGPPQEFLRRTKELIGRGTNTRIRFQVVFENE